MDKPNPRPPSGAGYEKKDINVRRVFIFGLLLVALIGTVGLGVTLLVFKGTAHKVSDAAVSPLYQPQELPPSPRLQAEPTQDLYQYRATEERILKSYGWIDRANGVVHIPIDHAIDLIVARGLPPKPEAAAKPIASPVPARNPK
jgi:hypothetical protein